MVDRDELYNFAVNTNPTGSKGGERFAKNKITKYSFQFLAFPLPAVASLLWTLL